MKLFRKKRIYFDFAAATPILPEVKSEMEKYWAKDFYNPNAIYEEGIKIKLEVGKFRKRIAEITGARVGGVIFTSGGTEANVLAIRGVKLGKIIVEPDSHPTLLETVLENNSEEITLISSPTRENKLGRRIREERKKNNSPYPLLHIDASQSALYFDIGLETLACDLLSLDASKLYGPKGVGALVVRHGVELKLPPRGTPPVPLIAGFVKALEIRVRDRESERVRLNPLRQEFILLIRETHPSIEIKEEEPNIVHVSIPGILPELLALALDRAGVLVSVGPACTSSKPEPDGTPIRFSFGRTTTRKDIQEGAKIFCKVAKDLVK